MTTVPRLWLWDVEYEARRALKRAQAADELDLLSSSPMYKALRAFFAGLPGDSPWPDPLPADFPRPVLALPESEDPLLSPDYIKWGSWKFVSRRLREAMALPEWAVSYVPAEIQKGGRRARQQDYALMYVRAFADAIDLDTSLCVAEPAISAKTGEPYISVESVTVIRFKAGLAPPCDLFEDSKDTVSLFATDALAERALAAGCNGVQFAHPLWAHEADGNYVIRTADGMAQIQWNATGQEYKIVPIAPEIADKGPQTEVLHAFQRVKPH